MELKKKKERSRRKREEETTIKKIKTMKDQKRYERLTRDVKSVCGEDDKLIEQDTRNGGVFRAEYSGGSGGL